MFVFIDLILLLQLDYCRQEICIVSTEMIYCAALFASIIIYSQYDFLNLN